MNVHAAGWQHSEKSVTSPKLTGKPKEVVTILHRLHFTSALKRMATLVRVRSAASCLDIGITLYNEHLCKLQNNTPDMSLCNFVLCPL